MAPAIVTSRGGLDAIMPCDLFAYARELDDLSLVSMATPPGRGVC